MKTDSAIQIEDISFFPLNISRWVDFETLFGAHGASGGCWCMFWRLPRKQFQQNCANCGEANRQALRALVQGGLVPGLIGYRDQMPVAWCSIAPREDFSSLERSRTLKRVDDRPVWSIVCFYIAKTERNSGCMLKAIQAAVEFARLGGAQLVEAYPTQVDRHHTPVELYMGSLETFLKAGFIKVAPCGTHWLVRFEI